MKFRAVITDSVHMRELLNVVTIFSRINKNLIINIQPAKVVIQIETEVEASQCLWCEIDAGEQGRSSQGYFSEYVMDGVDKEHNQIYLAVVAAHMVRALSYVRNNAVDYLKFKLVKQDRACLAVEFSGTSHNDSDIMCPKLQHDIPVTIAPRSEWRNFELPFDTVYDLTMLLPTVKSLRGLLDKKKNISPSVTIYATLAGELSLVVETDIVTVASHYRGLQCSRARPPDEEDSEAEPLTEAACKVDAKKLATLFESVNFCDMKMIANIKNDHLFNVKFEIKDNVFINFILPAVDFE
uniref:Checkpoint protein n=1 Tax=Culex pipiens TaxID=7175 RepID=A0A8D8D9S7_CULPI